MNNNLDKQKMPRSNLRRKKILKMGPNKLEKIVKAL